MAREDCPYRCSILDRQTQASLILHGLPDRINKGGVSWLVSQQLSGLGKISIAQGDGALDGFTLQGLKIE